MLRLRKSPPPFVPVPLGAGAFIRLRAAASSEVDAAAGAAGSRIAALMLGAEDARALSDLLPDLDLGDLVGLADGGDIAARLRAEVGLKSRLDLLTERLVLISLVARCNDGWTGVADEDGTPLDAPHEGSIALLLQDPGSRGVCHNAIYARYHAEAVEGNGSAASPSGGAAAAETTAPAADLSAAPAPAAGADQPAIAAPR